MKAFTATALVIILILVLGCSKKHPTIIINQPGNNQVFVAPNPIEVAVTIYDDEAVASAFFYITKTNATNDTVLVFKDHSTSSKYEFKRSFISEPNTQYKILVTALGHATWLSDSVFVSAQ